MWSCARFVREGKFIRVRNGKTHALVIDDEGLHSFKAIAFINSKGNICLETKSYSEPQMSTRRETAFLINEKFIAKAQLYTSVTVKIGEKLWKK